MIRAIRLLLRSNAGAANRESKKPSLRRRFRYWAPRWRFASLRILERLLVGREIALYSPASWSPAVPKYRHYVIESREHILMGTPRVVGMHVDSSDDRSQLLHQSWFVEAKHSYLLRDVAVDPVSGVPWIPGDDVLAEVSQFGVDPRWSDVPYQWTRRPRHWHGESTVIVAPNYPNYYHFLIEELPRFLATLEAYGADADLILRDGAPEWLTAALHNLGLSWTPVGRRPLIVKRYAVTGRSLMTPSEIDWILLRQYFGWKRSTPGQVGEKVYLSRAGYDREMPWEKDLAIILKREGWLVPDPASMSIMEQVDFFSRASIVAGNSGAAFANIVWMSPGSTTVLLSPPVPHHGYIWHKLCALSDSRFIARPTEPGDDPQAIARYLMTV